MHGYTGNISMHVSIYETRVSNKGNVYVYTGKGKHISIY
jgi:hypothetical protein